MLKSFSVTLYSKTKIFVLHHEASHLCAQTTFPGRETMRNLILLKAQYESNKIKRKKK